LAGAAFASQDLTEESADQQRGAVQVGDPFMEKLVCEACLELLATGAVAGIQGHGRSRPDLFHLRETRARRHRHRNRPHPGPPTRPEHDLLHHEIMLSESQERMLIIVQKGREDEVKRIFDKWTCPGRRLAA
jgi:phosphoribosylformylglycinamidine synthase